MICVYRDNINYRHNRVVIVHVTLASSSVPQVSSQVKSIVTSKMEVGKASSDYSSDSNNECRKL